MAVEISKELNSQQSIEDPEEDKEECDIVDLLTGPLEYLVQSCLGHGELEAGPDISDHDEGSGRPGQVEGCVVEAKQLKGVHDHRGCYQGQHGKVKLTPAGP